MSAAFDPYYKWLGIPPAEQPPNLYRLLAIPLFEPDADVIDAAADGRMTHLRTFSAGKNAPLAQKLLNEISAARVTLLNPQTRASYDAQLHAHLAAQEAARLHAQQAQLPPPLLPPGAEPPPPGTAYPAYAQAPAGPAFEIDAGEYSGRGSRGSPVLLLALVGCLAIGATIGGLWYVLRGKQQTDVVVDNPSGNSSLVDSNQPPQDPTTPSDPPPADNGTSTQPTTGEDSSNPSAPDTTPAAPGVANGNPGESGNPPTGVPTATTDPANTSPRVPSPPSTNPPANSNPNVPQLVVLKGHQGPVLGVDFSADGKIAVSGGEDKTVHLWDTERAQPTRRFEGMPSAVRCVRLSADGQYIAIACPDPDRLLRVWNVNQPTNAVDIRVEGPFESFEYSADGNTLIVGSEGFVQVFNAKTGVQQRKVEFNGNSTAISSDGRLLAAAGPGTVIRLFDIGTAPPVTLTGSKGMIGGLALSADHRVVVSGGTDRLLRVWDVQSERQVLRVRAPGGVRSVAVSEDGRRCASLGERYVIAWNLAERKQVFSHSQSGDCQPALSSDGRLLLMGDTDGMVRLITLPALPETPLPQQLAASDPDADDQPDGPPRTDLTELVNPRPRNRQPAPSESEIADATKQLVEIYPRTESKSAEEQLQLAEQLLQLAANSDQAVDQYALLQFAAKLAQRGGDARLAVKAFDELGARFTVDTAPLKARELTALAKGAKDEATIDSLVSVAIGVANSATSAGHLEEASDLLDAVASACTRPAGRRHAKTIAEYRAEFIKAKKPWAAARLAQAKLEAEPDNAEANSAAGAWTALGVGDWSTGLPMLVKGSDSKLKTLAELDLAAEQGGPPDRLKAADAWYDAAQAPGEAYRSAMLRRAGHWYTAILPMVKQPIAKLKIEGRLAEIAKLPSTGEAVSEQGELALGSPVFVLGLTDPRRDVLGGAEWVKRREAIFTEQPQFDGRFMLPVELQGSYEFEFDFTAPRGQIVAWLPVGGQGCQLWIAEGQQGVSGISFIEGQPASRNPTRTPMPKIDWTKRHTATVRVEQEGDQAGIDAFLDGKPLLKWRGPTASLSGELRNAIRDPKYLALGSINAPIMFHTARVKLLEGTGRITAQ